MTRSDFFTNWQEWENEGENTYVHHKTVMAENAGETFTPNHDVDFDAFASGDYFLYEAPEGDFMKLKDENDEWVLWFLANDADEAVIY